MNHEGHPQLSRKEFMELLLSLLATVASSPVFARSGELKTAMDFRPVQRFVDEFFETNLSSEEIKMFVRELNEQYSTPQVQCVQLLKASLIAGVRRALEDRAILERYSASPMRVLAESDEARRQTEAYFFPEALKLLEKERFELLLQDRPIITKIILEVANAAKRVGKRKK